MILKTDYFTRKIYRLNQLAYKKLQNYFGNRRGHPILFTYENIRKENKNTEVSSSATVAILPIYNRLVEENLN